MIDHPAIKASLNMLRRYRAVWLWAAWLTALAAVFGYSLALGRAAADNRIIDGLRSGRDLEVDTRARPDVILARALYLLERERIDDALALVETLAAAARTPGNDTRAAAALYSIGNARMRKALDLLERGGLSDAATAPVRLAKDAYLRALRLRPDDWDAKYNLDVASRLVRDFPVNEQDGDDDPPDPLSKLWTELPGLPRGLP